MVLSSVVRPPADRDRDFPTYGELVPVPEITEGKVGGWGGPADSDAGVPPVYV